ncbi:MAG: DUF5996 family protein, partial [Verrucomicrobiota bacterium]
TTGPIPHGRRMFEISFDFIGHELHILVDDGQTQVFKLRPQSVAKFYREIMSALAELGLEVKIAAAPNELPDATPFAEDEEHAQYDPVAARRFWQVLSQSGRVFTEFRSLFCGKCSPVHFFWGSFDLAVTRFSGRSAPPHPGGIPHLPDAVTREAYSQEVSSLGFWPGNDQIPEALFYSYAYPSPQNFAQSTVAPTAAYFHGQLKEWVLPYDAVRQAASPEAEILAFAQTTYDAAASLAGWDREALAEKKPALR